MPDRDVETIQDLLHYQYAKVICASAFKCANGKEAKKKHYGFIKETFRDLKSGKKSWSDIEREDWQFVESDKKCIYCGSESDIHREHIVPRSIRIKPECKKCDKIQGIHNQIWACRECNSSKGNKGLYEFYKAKHPTEKKYYDIIPPLAEKKYLKTIYNCHVCADTLAKGDLDNDREISVLDIDSIIRGDAEI